MVLRAPLLGGLLPFGKVVPVQVEAGISDILYPPGRVYPGGGGGLEPAEEPLSGLDGNHPNIR